MKKEIKEISKELGLADEVIDNIFTSSSYVDFEDLVDSPITFKYFIDNPGEEYIFDCKKDGEPRVACRCVATDIHITDGHLNWSDSEGDPDVPMGEDDDLMMDVGNSRWTYTIYKIMSKKDDN